MTAGQLLEALGDVVLEEGPGTSPEAFIPSIKWRLQTLHTYWD